jgi:hypothetical protein
MDSFATTHEEEQEWEEDLKREFVTHDKTDDA